MLALLGLVIVQAASNAPDLPQKSPKLPTSMRVLSQKELRVRVVGKRLTTTDEGPSGLDWDTNELFFEDGRYVHWFAETDSVGTYRFIGNRICVRWKPVRERCRTGYVDTNGDFWLLSTEEGREGIERLAISAIKK